MVSCEFLDSFPRISFAILDSEIMSLAVLPLLSQNLVSFHCSVLPLEDTSFIPLLGLPLLLYVSFYLLTDSPLES